jgi:hypothetical protein
LASAVLWTAQSLKFIEIYDHRSLLHSIEAILALSHHP